MNNFNNFVGLLDRYLEDKGYPIKISSDMQEVSFNSDEGTSLVKIKIPVVDMDCFAKKAYRRIKLPNSLKERDSINTADAFLIDKMNEWYFIEFKDAVISSSKYSVLKKAYSNAYAIMDFLYTMKEKKQEYSLFDYDNPIAFFQTNVRYLLVFSGSKNPHHVQQLKNHRLKKENYLPEFMERLQGYIYKEAYAVTEEVFEHTFIKNFMF